MIYKSESGKNIDQLFVYVVCVMVRPQVADGGTASNMEGSCEYIE